MENTQTLNASIHYHKNEIVLPLEISGFLKDNETFGVLSIDVYENKEIKNESYIRVNIDYSGSMNELCSDTFSKMDQLLFTIKNLFLSISNNKFPVKLSLVAFNDEVNTLFKNEKMCETNISDLCDSIKTIKPFGNTNIENILRDTQSEIEIAKQQEEDIVQILLTDGDITKGEYNVNELKKLIVNDVYNIFIGYGKYHNSYLLSELSEINFGEYKFIDDLKSSGFVYGEILSNIVYKRAKRVVVHITNGQIYNYKTNSWTDTLEIGQLSVGPEKIFQIKTKNVDLMKMNIKYYDLIHKKNMEIKNVENKSVDDLTQYAFRQNVQQLISEAKTIPQIDNITLKLKEFFDYFQTYIENNNLINNKFLKILSDDLYIIIKTINTEKFHKYVCARENSQGTQSIYNNVSIHEEPNENVDAFFSQDVCMVPKFTRQNIFEEDEKEPLLKTKGRRKSIFNTNTMTPTPDNISNYKLSKDNDFCYEDVKTTINLMREVSAICNTKE
jgi:hypothetical protein